MFQEESELALTDLGSLWDYAAGRRVPSFDEIITPLIFRDYLAGARCSLGGGALKKQKPFAVQKCFFLFPSACKRVCAN
ncbi:MAG: hypothetical protein CVT93_05970 [Bacteroidetes bacterium HGW-Bacteroidetes-10]|nr:MAG: hypothetical protein CVT93_05970 [Bacteroidetes bacterium HGW-Bacteroidetes-10]